MAASSNTVDGSEPHVEASPNGRYIRYSAVLGKGAYKTVYKAFDTEEALEVAWNKLHVDRLSVHDLDKVSNEVMLLRLVEHKNIIHFYETWGDEDDNGNPTINFITEQMMSGTLKEYLKKAKAIKLKVIRRWCRNILEAIAYLHSQTPPIMHRDLKCDNIFINGHVGEVKIGDLGLSGVKERDKAESVIGTPEFMAPELYEESYTEKVDIYAFGMCLLEIVTMEYPYSECNNMAQIFKKVFNGERPKAFDILVEGDVKEVINACLQREANRPSAATLLQHPLFRDWEQDSGKESNLSLVIGTSDNEARAFAATQSANAIPMGAGLIDWSDPLKRSVFVSISGMGEGEEQQVSVVAAKDSGGFYIGLEIPIRDAIKRVEFTFNPFEDNSQHIAQEMVSEFGLGAEQLNVIREEIDRQVFKAKEQREAASRNATPQHPSRQSQSEPKSSHAQDAPTSTDVPLVPTVISPPQTAPDSLTHVASLPVSTSAPVVSASQLPSASTSVLPPAASDPVLLAPAEPIQLPPANLLPPAVSVPAAVLETPSQSDSRPTSISIQDEQRQLGVSHHSIDVQTPSIAQHDLPMEQVQVPTSVDMTHVAPTLHAEQPVERVERVERPEHLEHPEHPEHPERAEHVDPGNQFQRVHDVAVTSGMQPDGNPEASLGTVHASDFPPPEPMPLSSDEPRSLPRPQPPTIHRITSVGAADSAVHASPALSQPVTAAAESPTAKDGNFNNDLVREREDVIRTVPSHEVSANLSFESPLAVDDPQAPSVFPTGEPKLSDSQTSLATSHELLQRISGSRSEVAMSRHQRAVSDAEIRESPSLHHVPHSASDGQLRPAQISHPAVTELPPRPPSTPITPDTGHHIIEAGEMRSRSPPAVPIVVQEGGSDNRVPSQKMMHVDAPTYPTVSSGLAAVAAAQQTEYARGRSSSSSIPPIVVVRPAATEGAGDGRQRKPSDSSSPATDASSDSYRSVYTTAGSGEHGAKVTTTSHRAASPQGRIPVVISSGHSSDAKVTGRISPDPAGQSSGPVRGSSWQSVQSVETTISMTPKNRKHDEGGGSEPKREKSLTKGLKLMDLCARGRHDDVKKALMNGASALFRDYDKRTPLHVCAGEGHASVCALLIENGAEISAKDRWGNTALSVAREKEHSKVVELLKRHGAEDEDEDVENLAFLHYCAIGDVEEVRNRISGGAQAASTDYTNRTPLHVACSEGHAAIAEILLVNGASADALDAKNRTPVDDAVSNGDRKLLCLLKRYGAKVPEHLFETSEEQAHRLGVELIERSASGIAEEVKDLLDYGADVNYKDYDQRTALHLACIEGHWEIVRTLIQAGGKLDARDRWSSTPLEDAVKAGFVSIVEKVREMERRRIEEKIAESDVRASSNAEMNGHVERQIDDSIDFQRLPDGIAIPSINLSADDFAAKYPSNEDVSANNINKGGEDGVADHGERVQREDGERSIREELQLQGMPIDGGAAIGMMEHGGMRFSPSTMSLSSISNSNGTEIAALPVLGVSDSMVCTRKSCNAPSPSPPNSDIRSMVEGLVDAATRSS